MRSVRRLRTDKRPDAPCRRLSDMQRNGREPPLELPSPRAGEEADPVALAYEEGFRHGKNVDWRLRQIGEQLIELIVEEVLERISNTDDD